MATHEVLVTMQLPSGDFAKEGELIDYDGAPDWKLEPIDLTAKKAWAKDHAKPDRVDAAREAMNGAQRGAIGRERYADKIQKLIGRERMSELELIRNPALLQHRDEA